MQTGAAGSISCQAQGSSAGSSSPAGRRKCGMACPCSRLTSLYPPGRSPEQMTRPSRRSGGGWPRATDSVSGRDCDQTNLAISEAPATSSSKKYKGVHASRSPGRAPSMAEQSSRRPSHQQVPDTLRDEGSLRWPALCADRRFQPRVRPPPAPRVCRSVPSGDLELGPAVGVECRSRWATSC